MSTADQPIKRDTATIEQRLQLLEAEVDMLLAERRAMREAAQTLLKAAA